MKNKMDIESKLYFWKVIIWVAPTIFLLISGGIVAFSNFKIHNIERELEEIDKIESDKQTEKDKTEIISSVTNFSAENKELIQKLKNVSNEELIKRNKIIGELYWYGLSEFLAKFRFVIHCLDKVKPLDETVIKTFRPRDITKAPNISLMTREMIHKLVMDYDFKKKSVNCDFTSSLLLLDISKKLNKKSKDILDKYASSGSPELIKEIELMANYTDNFIGSFGPWGERGIWSNSVNTFPKSRENSARDLSHILEKLKNDLEICKIYK